MGMSWAYGGSVRDDDASMAVIAEALDLGVAARSRLLTGAITSATFEEGDFRGANPRFTERALAANLRIVDAVRVVAERHGATPAQVAIAWTLAQGDHVIPVPGTKKSRYLRENIGAAELRLTADDLCELDKLPVGSRY
jgi:aryl-alcohol dehydrogenase-like predicted oxidoreductase